MKEDAKKYWFSKIEWNEIPFTLINDKIQKHLNLFPKDTLVAFRREGCDPRFNETFKCAIATRDGERLVPVVMVNLNPAETNVFHRQISEVEVA